MRWRRPSIKPSKFGTVYKKDCGECFVLRSFSFGETEPCAQSLSPYSSFVIARKRAVLALRAEFLFLSFPKEKGTKKKGNLRACALKDPPNCTDLLRSIKNGVFIIAEITGRASRDKIVRNRKKQRRVCTDITSSAHEPSPRGINITKIM